MRRRAWLLATLALPAWAQEDSKGLAEEVRARLVQPEWLRGEFEQSKRVPGFKKPLLARGDFIVARGRGVLWRTRTPFAGELKLTRDEIRATQGGVTAFRMDARSEPALRMINGLMFALLNGDVSGLAELFSLQGEAKGKSWTLALRPRAGALQQQLQSIELEGDAYVRRILIKEQSGDESLITLSQLRGDARAEPGLFTP